MKIHFTDHGWDDYQQWVRHDPATLHRLNTLIEDTRRNLFKGLGKPEPLKGDLAGGWSRRITGDHRLVYRIAGKLPSDRHIEIIGCRYYYGDG